MKMQDNVSRICYTNEVIKIAKSRGTISKTKAKLLTVLNYLGTNGIINVNFINKPFNQIGLVNIAKGAGKQFGLVNFSKKVKSQFSISPFSINIAKKVKEQLFLSLYGGVNIANKVEGNQTGVSILNFFIPNTNSARKVGSQLSFGFSGLNITKTVRKNQISVSPFSINNSTEPNKQIIYSLFGLNHNKGYAEDQVFSGLLGVNIGKETWKIVTSLEFYNYKEKEKTEKGAFTIIETIKEIISNAKE